jgi:hypothetical protein
MSVGSTLRRLAERTRELVENKKIASMMKPAVKEVSPKTLKNRAKRRRQGRR